MLFSVLFTYNHRFSFLDNNFVIIKQSVWTSYLQRINKSVVVCWGVVETLEGFGGDFSRLLLVMGLEELKLLLISRLPTTLSKCTFLLLFILQISLINDHIVIR